MLLRYRIGKRDLPAPHDFHVSVCITPCLSVSVCGWLSAAGWPCYTQYAISSATKILCLDLSHNSCTA